MLPPLNLGKRMQKQEQIVEMFNQIAPSYDKANRILSFGVDISWRKKACERVLKCFDEHKKLKIVDVACGTGDMLEIWQAKAKELCKSISSLIGIDPSTSMLKIAKKRFSKLEFIEAKAQELPLKDKSANIISISYGIRNVVQRKEALKEFFRVLDRGGILLILEFTKREKGGLVAWIRDFYLKYILPKIGSLISKNAQAYKYLPHSIDVFLSKEELIAELEEADFKMMYYESLSFGISSMFVATKEK